MIVTDANGIETEVELRPLVVTADYVSDTLEVVLDGQVIGEVCDSTAFIYNRGRARGYGFASRGRAVAACVSAHRYGYWTGEQGTRVAPAAALDAELHTTLTEIVAVGVELTGDDRMALIKAAEVLAKRPAIAAAWGWELGKLDATAKAEG